MAPDQSTSNKIPLSLKRRNDLTAEELKSHPLFKDYSEEELTKIIEAAKVFTRSVLYLHTNKQEKEKKPGSKTVTIIANPLNRAA